MGNYLIVMRNRNSESMSGESAKPDPAVSIQVFRAAQGARTSVIYTYSLRLASISKFHVTILPFKITGCVSQTNRSTKQTPR